MKFVFKLHKEIFEARKILVLDRDGVVIKDTGYPFKINELKFEIKNIIKLKNFFETNEYNVCGFATNQSGVSRSYFSENQFWECHKHIIKECNKNGLRIDFTAVNFFKSENYFRKPNPGMLDHIRTFYSIDFENIIFVGDKSSDEKAALNAGLNYKFIHQI